MSGVADLVAPDLVLLFVGINPGRRSGETGTHFAGPSNRFWKALAGSGLTDRLLGPAEQAALLGYGIGITNLVARPTASAAEIGRDELRAGAVRLEATVRRLRPGTVAFLGLGAYRTAFGRPGAAIGPQNEPVGGARAWLLPNPSGLAAGYRLDDLVALFAELARSLGEARPAGGAGVPVGPGPRVGPGLVTPCR